MERILENGTQAHGKIAVLVTDYLSFTDMAQLWEKITGKKAVYAELSDEAITKVWGTAGQEIAAQFRWSESFPSWERVAGRELITLDELGVQEKLVRSEAVLNSLKSHLA